MKPAPTSSVASASPTTASSPPKPSRWPPSGRRRMRRPASTTRPTAWTRRARRSTASTKTPSCRCDRSTTTASSSKKPRPSATVSARPTTPSPAANAIRTSSPAGASQVAEHRTGHLLNGQFFESLGGSLVHSRATHPNIVEVVAFEDDVRTFRISTNTLGAGFIEAIANSTLLAIRDRQPLAMRGTAVMVPVLEAAGSRTDWPLRVEEPAREPAVVLRRRLSERDGHHQPALSGREHLERAQRRRVRPGRGSRRRRRGHRRVRQLHAIDQGAVARPDHAGRPAGDALFSQDRLRDLSCAGDHDRGRRAR